MAAPAVPPSPSSGVLPLTLAARPFPWRVRRLLEGVLEYVSDALESGIARTLDDLEQELFKLAEQGRSNDTQVRYLEAVRSVKRNRADVVPHCLVGVEAELAALRDPPAGDSIELAHGPTRIHGELTLVEDIEMDERGALREIASRAELRNSLSLYLLCQRFGVLAGRPAFDAETLPVGPHALCRILRGASECLDLTLPDRLLLFRLFERHCLSDYAGIVDTVNNYLIGEHVLPHLQFVPTRVNPSERRADVVERAVTGAAATTPQPPRPPQRTGETTAGMRPQTAWPGESLYATPSASTESEEMFGVLRQLLAGRRQLIDKFSGATTVGTSATVASASDVQSVLGILQHRPVGPVLVDGKPAPRSIAHVKQDLLAQLRQTAPDGHTPALNEEDGDTIDLVGMLFDHIMKEVRAGTPAASLLTKLQVPLLRVALHDKEFFTQQQHPARQMLNAVAETGAYWLGDDAADRGLTEKMGFLVDRAVNDFDGDPALFDSLSRDLGAHLQTVAHKAEVSERRHVEAARGKEKLALARQSATKTVDDLLAGKRLPRFLTTLITQAWTDVLALTALRQGEQSPEWNEQVGIAARLIESAGAKSGSTQALAADEARLLRDKILHALNQVGYHDDEAGAIAQRLLATSDVPEDDAASRTELALKLKNRARLGEDARPKVKSKPVPLTAEEKACLEQLKQLPFGTWMEFTVNQQGDRVRHRMSWFSTVTGHTLFVNHRGQRVAEHSLDSLARSLAADRVRIVQSERGNLIDRAWSSVLSALRSFAGRVPAAATASAS